MNYFECNISRTVPKYYHPNIYRKLEETIGLIHNRTDKLNQALEKCTLKGCATRGATFSRIAKTIFDFSDVKFDSMNPSELAGIIDQLYDGTDAEEREEWPNSEVVFDTAFVTTKDWEALRHIGIGGSDSSVLMGLNPYQTEEGLWYEKLGYPEHIYDEDKNAIFARGHFIEPVVIRTFANLVGAHVVPETRMFRSKKYPVATANIDGILRMPNGKLAIFEAKTAVVEKKGEWMGKKIPPNYVTQCHQYMAVLDDPRIECAYIGMIPVADITLDGTYIGSAYNDDFYHHRIERDEIYEKEILESESEFWEAYIENGIKPERSKGIELDKQIALKYAPSPISDPTIPAPELEYEAWKDKLDRMIEADKAYTEQKKICDRLEGEKETAKLEVLDALQGAQQGLFKDKRGSTVVTVLNKIIHKTTADTKKLKEFYPEAWEAVKKERSYTRFSFKLC